MSARSFQAKQARTAKWDVGFITCTLHPDRRCNRSDFTHTGSRRCASCKAWHRATPLAREKNLIRCRLWCSGDTLKALASLRLTAKSMGVTGSRGKRAAGKASSKSSTDPTERLPPISPEEWKWLTWMPSSKGKQAR